jgi:hypothetical protein
LRAGTTWAKGTGSLVGVARHLNQELNLGLQLPPQPTETDLYVALAAGTVLVFSAVALLFKLYRKWIGGDLSAEEKGSQAWRAWLSADNIVCCVLVSLGAWLGYGFSFWWILALTLGAVAVYPLIQLLQASPEPAAAAPAEDLSAERERVLKLLEAGKITAEESAQLLGALGETARPPVREQTAISAAGKIVLAGGLAVVVGFFLPWFAVNVGQELSRAAKQLGNMAPMNFPTVNLNTGITHIAGGDIPHGLGWVILFLGIAAVVLPYVNPALSRSAQMKIVLAALGAGLLVWLYLLSENMRYASAGLILTGVGYGLMIFGTLKEGRKLVTG